MLNPPDLAPRAAVTYNRRSSLKRYCGVTDHVHASNVRSASPLTGAPKGLTIGVSTVERKEVPGRVVELFIDARFSSRCQRRPVVTESGSWMVHVNCPNTPK